MNRAQNRVILAAVKLDLPDEGKTLDALDVGQGTVEDKVVGVGGGTR